EALVPAICEYLSIPYTGSDPLTLALSLHKGRTKETLAFRGVPTAPFACLETPDDLDRLALPFPVFVKPIAEGSGKGVFSNNLCDGPRALAERVRFLTERYAEPVLVETYLPGPEFTVAILGNGPEAYCLPVVGFDFSTLPPGARRGVRLRRADPGSGTDRLAAAHRAGRAGARRGRGAACGAPARGGSVRVKLVILYDPGAEDWTPEDIRGVMKAVDEIGAIFG